MLIDSVESIVRRRLETENVSGRMPTTMYCHSLICRPLPIRAGSPPNPPMPKRSRLYQYGRACGLIFLREKLPAEQRQHLRLPKNALVTAAPFTFFMVSPIRTSKNSTWKLSRAGGRSTDSVGRVQATSMRYGVTAAIEQTRLSFFISFLTAIEFSLLLGLYRWFGTL